MTTPNLDATQHSWVESLARFTFSIGYQKGRDNGATDALSHVISKLDAVTMKSILDGVIMGMPERADAHHPAVVDTDEEIHKQVQESMILARTTQVHADLHVTYLVTTQQEDLILKTLIKWISNWEVKDLKHLLGNDADTKQGKTILREQKKVMIYQGALYYCHMPTGELEEVLQFVVPKAHWVAAMNGCHQDAGHQGQQWTLCLLHDWVWWPCMATQMQKAVSGCEWCIQHEGIHAKAPMWPIIVTTPLELLHVDFTSIVTTIKLDQPPNMVNLLVFCDHFTKHVMAYMTPNQTAKSVAKFLWQGYIMIFRAPAKLLSDWEANIIRELCELMGIWKVRISSYHAQTNGQVEWDHQMLMCMIGKLSKDWKVDWPGQLPELVHAYNSTRLTITRYSPHYLMFGCWPCLPINFYSLTVRGMKKHQCVGHYVAKPCKWLQEAFKEAQMQSTSGAERQNRNYGRKANAISLEPGDLVLAKADAYRVRRKVKDQWEEELYKVECQIIEGIPSYHVKNQWTGCSQVLQQNGLFLIAVTEGTHLCTVVQAKWARCTTSTLEEQTQKSETEKAPQSVNCPLLTQHQTCETPLGKVNRKICAFIWTFSGTSKLDQCRGRRGVWESMSAFWQWKYWSHRWSSKIQLAMITTTPPLLDLEIASSKFGVWNGSASPCINLWGNSSILHWC